LSTSLIDIAALDPVLTGVYRRGYSIRRQRLVRRIAAGALTLQLVVALPYALRQGDDAGGQRVRIVAPAMPEDTTTTTTIAEEVVPVVVAEEQATTTTTTASPVVSATTTTTLVCRNSTDPRCGDFRWVEDPGPNQPATMEVRFEPEHPVAGEEVRFYMTARDPDAAHVGAFSCTGFGDEVPTCISATSFARDDPTQKWCASEKYGPWELPPRGPGVEEWGNPPGTGATHVYVEPGTYTATFERGSRSTSCWFAEDPYASTAKESIQVVVSPA
jgi:hypothetical protein